MFRFSIVSCVILILYQISSSQQDISAGSTYLKDYIRAGKLIRLAEKFSTSKEYSEEKEDALYLDALHQYLKAVPEVEAAGQDSLAFHCYSRLGFLWYFFDSLDLAKHAYLYAIGLKQKKQTIPDSSLFQPLLFTGSIFYRQNNFDSAHFYFKKAESISDAYSNALAGTERLYNWLGGMYYETGNYRQAKNYFEKANSLLTPSNPDFKDLSIRYKNNIAASLTKLEQYTLADSIYTSLLSYGINTNEILNNIGIINLRSNRPDRALEKFKLVHFNNELNVALFNHLGKTYDQLGKPDSADKYLALALAEHRLWNRNRKTIHHGITYQYLAERFVQQHDYSNAILSYQQAINQFYPAYLDSNTYHNPETFSGVFSYIDLFNTLVAKANAFYTLYHQDTNIGSLNAALAAYRSAFKLITYVERVYESDEARGFINKIKYNVHDIPIQISLEGYERTHSISYLQDAYIFDQQTKASILALNVKANNIKKEAGFNSDLFVEESSIKTATTRLILKAAQLSDSVKLQKINNTLRDYEIQLGKLQEKMNELPGYKQKMFAMSSPTVSQVQQLIDQQTAVLSYHLSQDGLVILCITANELSYVRQVIDSSFYTAIKDYRIALDRPTMAKKYDGIDASLQLYKKLILPIWNKIRSSKNLVIIPDDELNSLPFEALQDAKDHYLIQNFSVQYQYSSSLLRANHMNRGVTHSILAIAPFSNRSTDVFNRLEYSKNEIEGIDGSVLLDSAATKNIFLEHADHYSILHLATHTIINDSSPEKSLIAFYPVTGKPKDEGMLYLPEIYNLQLDSAQLVILSACETGFGKLTKGEGLMSLARAFSYAGCANIIASLWKADDQSTAWIMQRFYYYVHRGSSFAHALQKAKLDYLKSPDIEKRFKSPDYWAHLSLTGILPPLPESHPILTLIELVLIITFLILGYRLLRSKK